MKMTTIEVFNRLRADLVGQEITHVWRGHGSALFLEIGDLTPQFRRDGSPAHPEGIITLSVEWSWRIEDDISIVCGSWSEEELWEPAFEKFRNAHIQSCETFGALPEICLSTDKGLRFISFSTTDGQPQWTLADRRGDKHHWFSVRHGQLHLGDGTEPKYA